MKKITAMTLLLAMALSVASCGGGNGDTNNDTTTSAGGDTTTAAPEDTSPKRAAGQELRRHGIHHPLVRPELL